MEMKNHHHAQGLLPREKKTGTHWIGGCGGGSTYDVDDLKKKSFAPYRDSNPYRPASSLHTVPTTLPRLHN